MTRQAHYAVKFSPGWPTDSWRIYDSNSRLSSFVESATCWQTRDEAQAAADRCNDGDCAGVKFAMYADD